MFCCLFFPCFFQKQKCITKKCNTAAKLSICRRKVLRIRSLRIMNSVYGAVYGVHKSVYGAVFSLRRSKITVYGAVYGVQNTEVHIRRRIRSICGTIYGAVYGAFKKSPYTVIITSIYGAVYFLSSKVVKNKNTQFTFFTNLMIKM